MQSILSMLSEFQPTQVCKVASDVYSLYLISTKVRGDWDYLVAYKQKILVLAYKDQDCEDLLLLEERGEGADLYRCPCLLFTPNIIIAAKNKPEAAIRLFKFCTHR